MFIDLVTIAAFLVITLLIFLIGDKIAGGRRVARSLAAGAKRLDNADGRYGKSVLGPLTQALATIIPQTQSEVRNVERDLKRAGYYRSTALLEYMATRNALIVIILIMTGLGAVAADPGSKMPELIITVGLITSGLGYALPRFMLRTQAQKRVDRIQKGLPDALDLITMCLTGGLPMSESLERVSSELMFSHRDIAIEFDIIRRQAEADTMANALRQFASRIDTPDINALASLISQTQRMGTHVATAVCDYADSVRRTYRQRAEEQANKTSIKLLFPVVLCLSPPIYILLLGPPVLKLREFVTKEHQPGGVLSAGTDDPRVQEVLAERRDNLLARTAGDE